MLKNVLPETISTSRLSCKLLYEEPFDAVAALFDELDEEAFRHIAFEYPTDEDGIREFVATTEEALDSGDAALYLTYNENQTPIGYLGFWNVEPSKRRTEVGGVIAAPYRQRGYFSEWFNRAIELAFTDFDMEVVLGVTSVNNDAAIAACEHLFPEQQPIRLPNEVLTTDGPTDGFQFAYQRDDWQK